MALTVEDGTGLANANSYASAADVRSYALARGVALPADDSAVEPLIIQAMDYLEAQRAKFQGEKSFPLTPQALQWPRTDVSIDGNCFPVDQLPKELVSALAQCVIEISQGSDLQANTDGQVVKRERVDVIDTFYMTADEAGLAGLLPRFPKVDALLAPLFGNRGLFLKSVRV